LGFFRVYGQTVLDRPLIEFGRYLGFNLDKRLTFASHTAESIKKVERVFRIRYLLLNRQSKLCIQNKFLLYKSCIQPILCCGWQHFCLLLQNMVFFFVIFLEHLFTTMLKTKLTYLLSSRIEECRFIMKQQTLIIFDLICCS
jgi:hypothetical protein